MRQTMHLSDRSREWLQVEHLQKPAPRMPLEQIGPPQVLEWGTRVGLTRDLHDARQLDIVLAGTGDKAGA